MTDSYLTSSDMDMIQRVLAASSRVPPDRELEIVRARFLVECFERGMTKEEDLRRALSDHSVITQASPMPRPGPLSTLYRTLAAHRDTGIALDAGRGVEGKKRLVDNDTDGSRRRMAALKARHLLH